jgi:hypothetical protein
MITMDVTFKNQISQMTKEIKKELKQIPQEAFDFFRNLTPINKDIKAKSRGNAKRSTSLKGNKIIADYPYAEVLDKGRHMTNRGMRGSDQAPKGMTKPTEDFIQKRVDKIFQGK